MSERLKGDFRKFMDKNYLGAWDLPDNGDLVLTIDYVARDDVQNEKGREKKMTLHFKERDYKPMICNTTNAKRISKAYGSTKVEDWTNKKIAIYTEKVTAFGGTTDALRVRDYPPKTDEFFCEDCGSAITSREGHSAKAIANQAFSKYGRYLCWDCAIARKEASDEQVGS